MRILSAALLTFGLAAAFAAESAAGVPPASGAATAAGGGILRAAALLAGRTGSTVTGTVSFQQQGERVTVHVHVMGAAAGAHGLHIHDTGDCSDAEFKTAGAHFNPAAAPHGAPGDARHHAGDLGNIEIDANGHGMLDLTSSVISLAPGPSSIIGKAVIVHEKADDLKTQPSGDSGARIACGVVRARP